MFAYILFKSRAHRDRVNAKVMKDPRLIDSMDVKSPAQPIVFQIRTVRKLRVAPRALMW